VGVAIGVPLSALVSIAFTQVFVDIGGVDPGVIAVATVILAMAATVATAVPARRATKVQPLTALRSE
jgi:ABC-type antimicrobial peptide transport system permease subunit